MKIFNHDIDLPARLRHLRKQNELTQQQVADGLGMNRSAYGAYEEGRAEPNLHMLSRLSSYYSYTSLEEFCGVEPKKHGCQTPLMLAYSRASKEARAIVDFILKIDNKK